MKQRKNPQEGFYSISQVADLLHVSTHTIRNLEREFSLEVTKDSSGNRIYNLETVEKYRILIEKKNESKFTKFEQTTLLNDSVNILDQPNDTFSEITEPVFSEVLNDTSSSYNKNSHIENKKYSLNNVDTRNLISGFSPIHIANFASKFFGVVSFAVILISSFVAFGMVSLNTFLKDFDQNGLLFVFDRKDMSNVLQSSTEDFTYRFDVNVPAYMNNSLNVSGSLAGSSANFQIITVGQVQISQTGISAPNVVNLVSTRAGESVILVDNSNRNQPVITLAANPEFDTVTINNLNGVTALDDTTIQTIQDNIEIPTANADAETLGGLNATDFLRSNANTLYTGGTLEFGTTSSVKFSNLASNTFLRLNSQNILTSYDIVAGTNITISTTANSLVISASTGASNNVFSSAAIQDLFLGSTSFDEAYRVVATATELNKLHTLSGNLVTTSNITAALLTAIPNIDTNASDDLDNAVLITSLGGKTIYSTNTWYGTQDFTNIKSNSIEVEENGYLKIVAGVSPVITNSSLYNVNNRLYFEDLPILQATNTSITENVNKLAYFVTNASGDLFVQGAGSLSLNIFETGANGQILAVTGNTTKYLNINGDISVTTTSSSTITFELNAVNSTPGTFGSGQFIPQITVNSKGQITSITTVASSSNNYTSAINFSTPSFGNRVLTLDRFGLSSLTANFSLGAADITAPLGFTPLKNTSDTLSGNLLVTGTLSASQIYQNGSLVCDRSGNCNDIYFDTTNANNYVTAISFSTPVAGQRALILSRDGLTNLTAIFSISSSDVTTALGYTPLGANDTTADKFINSVGISTDLISQNVTYMLTLGRSDLAVFSVPFNINPAVVTTALGYIPLKNTTDSMSGNLIVTGTISAGSIFIDGNLVCDSSGNCSGVYVDTTNANNYVTGINFSTPVAGQRTLTLTRFGLTNLTASFSLSNTDVVAGLGYTPLQANDTIADKFINTFGISKDPISQNLALNFSLGRSDGAVILATTYLTPSDITTALGYTPLQASDTAADKYVNSIGTNLDYISQNVQLNFSVGRSDLTVLDTTTVFTPAFVTTALGYTPLRATDTVADKFINSFGLSSNASSQNVSYFFSIARNDGTTFPVNFALTPFTITTALGYTPLSATDTVPSYFVSSISFSDAASNTKVFTLNRQGTNALSAIFSLSSSDITTALGYTPLNSVGGTISGNLTITGSLSANKIFQNGNAVCDFSGNCQGGSIFGSGTTGYISLFNASSSISNSNIFQSSLNIGIGTTNPTELLDVYGAIKLSQDMGTAARSNALYQAGGVLYWNGQAVGVVGSTAPGGISGTKDYFPYFNTKDTLIASDFKYISSVNERGLELVTQSKIPVYMSIGNQNQSSFKIGVEGDNGNFFSNYSSEDDVVLVNSSNLSTSDTIFSNINQDGKFIFTFGVNNVERRAVTFDYVNSTDLVHVGINTTLPLYALHVTGDAKISGTLAVPSFSNPNSGEFNFFAGANFRGDLSAAVGNFTNLTLANALQVIYGGTGITQTPANGQLLIGSNGGYALAPITAGTNITISTTAGGITINAVLGGTNANNYVTAITFSNPADAQKTLILSRLGLSDLTATFSLSSADITTGLGYTPLQAGDTTADKFINSFGLSTNYSSENVAYSLSIARNDGVTFPVSFNLTPAVITTALGYTPQINLGYTPLQASDTAADKYINSVGTSLNYISQNVQLNLSLGRSDLTVINAATVFTPAFVTTALGYTPLRSSDTEAEKYINSFGLSNTYSSQNVSYFFSIARNDGVTFPVNFALTPSVITTALGYTPLQASDTAADKFINSYGVSTSLSLQNVSYNFSIARNDGLTFPVSIALNPSVITTALGYIPLQASDTAADKFINSFGLSTNLGFQNVSYNFSIARNDGITFPVNFALTPSIITSALGYTPLGSANFIAGANISLTSTATSLTISSSYSDTTNANNFVTSVSFSDAAANNKVFTLNREGTNALSTIFSLSSSDITTALGFTPQADLGYTPVNKAGDSISGNLVVDGTLAGNIIFQNGFMVCDTSGNCAITNSDITSALGYTPLRNTSDTLSGTLVVTETLAAVTLLQNGNLVCDTSGNCSGVYLDTNNFVSAISFADSAAGTKVFTLSRQGTNALSALFSLSSSDITAALTYTPVNKAGDTISGNLVVSNTLVSSNNLFSNANIQLSLSARHLFLADTDYTEKFLHLDSDIGNYNSKLILDLNVGSSHNSTLGMLIQSASFSSPFGLSKNLTFNVLDSEINTRIDIKREGTIPSIYQGSVDFYGATLLGADASFDNLGVTYQFSAGTGLITGNFSAGNSTLARLSLNNELYGTTAIFTGNVTLSSARVLGNLSASTAFVNGYFSAGTSSLAGLALTSDLYGTTALFSGNVTMASANITGNLTAGSAVLTGGLTGTTANFSGNASFASAFIANNFSVAGTGFFNTVATGVFSTPLASNNFTFLGNANFSGNISAANGTFLTLSAGSLNVANLFTVDSTGSVFNNNVTFNDTIEFNAVGDVAIANDLVFTNTSLSKIRSANDIIFEVGEAYNSSNITFNMFNSGEFIVNGDMQFNGVVNGTFATSYFSTPLANNTFNFLGGTIANAYFSSPLANNTFYFNSATIAASTFSNPSAGNFTFLGNLSAANASFVSMSIAGMSLQFRDVNDFAYNIGTGYSYNWEINGTSEMKLSNSTLSLAGNNLISVGGLSAAGVMISESNVIGKDYVYGINDVWTTGEFGWFDDVGQNTYIGLPADNQVAITLNGAQEVLFTATQTTLNNNLFVSGAARITTSTTVTDNAYVCTSTTTGQLEFKTAACTVSSQRFKENITSLPYSIADIMELRPVIYNYKDWDDSNPQGRTKERIGFIAEEVNEVVPEVVYKENGVIESLDYSNLISLLTKGIQEQQVQISSMSAAIATVDFSQASSMYNSLLSTINALSMSTDNGDLVVGTDLIVNGKTIMNDATFTGNVQVGLMSFDTLNNDLSVLGASCVRSDGTLDDALCQSQSLYLMKNKAGNLNIFDGKVVLKPNGDMQIEKINVTEIKADEYKVASSSQVSGTETLLAGQTEIVITTNKVKSNSKVFVTASNNLEGKTLYVDEKVDGISFKVKINQSMTTDVKFDWFILNVE